MMSPEEALIRAFVRPERRTRLLTLLGDAKRRSKLRASLAHFHDLDLRFAQRVSGLRAGEIEVKLRAMGAPDRCHVLSESAELDGQTPTLEVALEAVVGRGMGALISCIPGRLGYFESEEVGERYILQRAASSTEGLNP